MELDYIFESHLFVACERLPIVLQKLSESTIRINKITKPNELLITLASKSIDIWGLLGKVHEVLVEWFDQCSMVSIHLNSLVKIKPFDEVKDLIWNRYIERIGFEPWLISNNTETAYGNKLIKLFISTCRYTIHSTCFTVKHRSFRSTHAEHANQPDISRAIPCPQLHASLQYSAVSNSKLYNNSSLSNSNTYQKDNQKNDQKDQNTSESSYSSIGTTSYKLQRSRAYHDTDSSETE